MSFNHEQDRHDALIHVLTRIAEGIEYMANAETQALADLSTAVTAVGTAITAEIAELKVALGNAGVDNSPEIEQRVSTLTGLAASLTASLPATPPAVTAAPTITGMTPTTGPAAGGTSVTLTGIGFKNASAVAVGGVAATGVSAASDTSLTFTTPAGTAGPQPVVVTNPGGTNDNSTLFTFV